MRIAKNDVPVKIDAPGALARQKTGFGDATAFGQMGAEVFRFGEGTDITELLKGLEGDLCQSPHWGYMIAGQLTVTYSDGTKERPCAGDLIYWPPGHTVRAEEESEVVLFSPEHEHTAVMDHVKRQVEP